MLLQDMALTAAFTVGALTLCCLPGAAQQQTDIPRETVLDEIAHLQQELFEVPAVPPLCNLLPSQPAVCHGAGIVRRESV